MHWNMVVSLYGSVLVSILYRQYRHTDIFKMCHSIGIKFMDSFKYEYGRVVLFQKIKTIISAASGIQTPEDRIGSPMP